MTEAIGGVAAIALQQYVERWERLQKEKEAIAEDQKQVMAEAKAQGFDTKIIREVIKLRKLSQAERDEREALIDIYKAALGMLNDTPLGEAAIRRLSGDAPTQSAAQSKPASSARPEIVPPEDAVEPDEEAKEPEASVDDARAMGRRAAEAQSPVTANPFPARDPRRAAWDEGWCSGSGGTGMEIPSAWRRGAKKGGGENGEDAADSRSAAA